MCDFYEWSKEAKCQARNLVAIPQECSIAKTLRLQDNRVEQLVRGSFANFTCLKYLFLERNNLTVERGSFEGCSSVERIQLNNNHLYDLTKETMEGLSDVLLVMLIDNSEVREIQPMAFEDLTRLQFLSLKDNKLTTPPCQAFSADNDLQSLYLSGNMISTLPNGCFEEFTRVTKLYLNNNPLEDVNGLAFRGLSELTYLDLRNTSLTRVPTGIFSYTHNVETLQLPYNKIEHLSNRDFVGLSRLKNLYLENNRLVTIHHQSFEFMNSLEILDLSNNMIESIGKDALREQRSLKELRLQNNSLTSTKNISFSVIPHDAKVNLSNNPLHCDCSIYPFKYWLERATTEVPATSQARCASPPKFAGRLVSELTQDDICPDTSQTPKGTSSLHQKSITPKPDPYTAYHSANHSNQQDHFSNVQLIAVITGVIVAIILVIGIFILLHMRKKSREQSKQLNHKYADDFYDRRMNITPNPMEDKPPLPPRDIGSHRISSVSSTQPLLCGPNSPTLQVVHEMPAGSYGDSISHPRPPLSGQTSQTSTSSGQSSSDTNKSSQVIYY